jgi:hypothetical protein
MKCTNDTDGFREDLGGLLDGELTAERRAEVEEHVGACECCREELARLKKLSGLLGKLQRPAAPRGLAASIMSSIASGKTVGASAPAELAEATEPVEAAEAARPATRPEPAGATPTNIFNLRLWMTRATAVAAVLVVGIVVFVIMGERDSLRPHSVESDMAKIRAPETELEYMADSGAAGHETRDRASRVNAQYHVAGPQPARTMPQAAATPAKPAPADRAAPGEAPASAPAPALARRGSGTSVATKRKAAAGRVRARAQSVAEDTAMDEALDDVRPEREKKLAGGKRPEPRLVARAEKKELPGDAFEELVGERERFAETRRRDAPAATRARPGRAAKGDAAPAKDRDTLALNDKLRALLGEGDAAKKRPAVGGAGAAPGGIGTGRSSAGPRMRIEISGKNPAWRRIRELAKQMGGHAQMKDIIDGIGGGMNSFRVRIPANRALEFVARVRAGDAVAAKGLTARGGRADAKPARPEARAASGAGKTRTTARPGGTADGGDGPAVGVPAQEPVRWVMVEVVVLFGSWDRPAAEREKTGEAEATEAKPDPSEESPRMDER